MLEDPMPRLSISRCSLPAKAVMAMVMAMAMAIVIVIAILIATLPIGASAAVLKEPPGPMPLPSIGSNGLGSLPLIGLGKATGIGPPPHRRMHQLAERYGDVLTLSVGREPWVILSSPEAVHEAFVVRGSDFGGRPMVPSMGISSGNGKGFARKQPDPGLARLRKAAFAELFNAGSVRRSVDEFEAEAKLLVDHWVATSEKEEKEESSASGECDGGVAIRPGLRRAVANMVLRYAFSVRVPYDGEEDDTASSTSSSSSLTSPLFEELVDVVDRLWDELTSTQTFLTDLVTEPRIAQRYYEGLSPIPSLVKRRDELIRTIVARRRTERERESKREQEQRGGDAIIAKDRDRDRDRDMLDVLLDASLPESDVMYTLVDLFVAGVNTVSTTLEWMLLITADQPHHQTRARADLLSSRRSSGKAEADSVKDGTSTAAAAAAATTNAGGNSSSRPADACCHRQRISYADALIRETLRYKPPLLLPRRTVADTTIGSHRIPAGRIVLANNWALTRDANWWESPHDFRPERWWREEAESDDAIPGGSSNGNGSGGGGAVESCKYIPFSIGKRACPGRKLAEAELSAVTTVLLRSVSWSPSEPRVDLREEYSLTLTPRTSQSLRFHRLQSKPSPSPSPSPIIARERTW